MVGDGDPAERRTLAHDTAAAVLRLGQASDDPEVTRRLVRLVDEVGLDEVAELWRQAPAGTLPGTLWGLYLLRVWVRGQPAVAADLFAEGRRHVPVATVVAGVADPPGPAEVAVMIDAMLTSAFDADLADALDRAAAFARVVAAGRAHRADDADAAAEPERAGLLTRLAAGSLALAERLELGAALWRAGRLS